MAKRKSGKRGRKQARNNRVSTHRAPGQNLVGSTLQWNLRQVVPIFVPSGVQPGRNYFVQIIASVEGFRYEVLQDGFVAPIGTSVGNLYGETTGQFDDLQRLWTTYRVNKVKARFTPTSMYQLGSISPSLTIVDVLGGDREQDFPNTIGWYSRSRNLIVHHEFGPVERTVDYSNWLVQMVDKPFLRTDIGGRVREKYDDGGLERLPGIQMGFIFTPSQNVSAAASGYCVGFLDLNALFEFRGRRLDEPFAGTQPYPMLTTPNVDLTLPGQKSTQAKASERIEDLSVSSIATAIQRLTARQ